MLVVLRPVWKKETIKLLCVSVSVNEGDEHVHLPTVWSSGGFIFFWCTFERPNMRFQFALNCFCSHDINMQKMCFSWFFYAVKFASKFSITEFLATAPGKYFKCAYLTGFNLASTSHYHKKGAFCASFDSKDNTKPTDHEPLTLWDELVAILKLWWKRKYILWCSRNSREKSTGGSKGIVMLVTNFTGTVHWGDLKH